jgi:hypothetical protein
MHPFFLAALFAMFRRSLPDPPEPSPITVTVEIHTYPTNPDEKDTP